MKSKDDTLPYFNSTGKLIMTDKHKLYVNKSIDNNAYKDTYVMLFSAFYNPALLSINSAITFKVYFHLMFTYNTINCKPNEDELRTIFIKQSEIAAAIGSTQQVVAKSLATLLEKEFLLSYSRGKVTLNPLYVWKGSLADWQAIVTPIIRAKRLVDLPISSITKE